jgi:ATP-dependent DNA ligase
MAGGSRIPRNAHDGYRLIERRDGDTVRLFTRRGLDNTPPDRWHRLDMTHRCRP